MNTLKTGILMVALFALFMGLGRILGGANGLVIGFVLALGMNFFSYWFSDRVALSMSGAEPVSEAEAPELYSVVRDLSGRAGLPMPRVYVIPTDQPNAFATGRNPHHAAVAATEGLLQMLSRDELEGVMAHELAHVRNHDILVSSIAATMVGTITMVTQILQMQAFYGGGRDDDDGGANPLVALVAALVTYFAAILIQLAISRSREYEADRVGARISGQPLGLAHALLRIEGMATRRPMRVNPATSHMYIVNPLGQAVSRGLASAFRTHPLTEDRVRRLEAMAYDIGQTPGPASIR